MNRDEKPGTHHKDVNTADSKGRELPDKEKRNETFEKNPGDAETRSGNAGSHPTKEGTKPPDFQKRDLNEQEEY